MNSADAPTRWSPLAAFALAVALLVFWVALGAGLAIAFNRLEPVPADPVSPATIAVAGMIASAVSAVLAAYLIGIRGDRSEVFGMPRGGITTLIVVPLVFAAAAYGYQLAKTALRPLPPGPSSSE